MSERLTDQGVIVVEAFVPNVARFVDGQTVRASRVGRDHVSLEAARHDPLEQSIDIQQIVLTEHGAQLLPVRHRYAWPSELELMARLAGLELRHRWGGWERSAFTASSTTHVSVYARRSA